MGETTLIVAVLLLFSFYTFAQSLEKQNLAQGALSLGNTYLTLSIILAATVNGIYKMKWLNNFIAYAIPVVAIFPNGIFLIKVIDKEENIFVDKLALK